MSVMKVLRKGLPTATLPVVAGLTAVGLAIAPAAQAVSAAPVRADSASLHVTAKVDLGRLGPDFSYVLTEAPDGNVYYSRGSVVYLVKGDHAPVTALRASGPVLAVAANLSDLFVDIGNKVSAYALSDGRRLRTWTLPSIATVTSAGLFTVGTTVWAVTDWATDESGFEYANVDRLSLSSPTVHRVSANNAYPGDMAADLAGLYYEGIAGAGDYLFRAPRSGSPRRHADVNIDAPLALAAGNVYLLAVHDNQGDNTYLDAFRGSTLSPVFSERVSDHDTDIAGTGIGLLLLGPGRVSLLEGANGHQSSALSVPGAVVLVPGPSAAVVTVSHSTAYLLRLAG
ncbi:MAG: hypothetical protein ACRDOA_05655 [Streptosporangiaceae bacterium]